MNIISELTLFYTSCGMFATWLVQIHSLRFKYMSRFVRVREAFICSLFTAAVSIPLLDFYPNLPPSISLIIGALMGTIGMDGWRVLADTLLNLFAARLGLSKPVNKDKNESK